jgi:hypothetical protein
MKLFHREGFTESFFERAIWFGLSDKYPSKTERSMSRHDLIPLSKQYDVTVG